MYIYELLIDSQINYNLIVIFICHVFCIYKKLFEKVNITSAVLNCLTNTVIYSSTLKY